MSLFIELSLIIFSATAVGLIMKLLRQPLIVGYIIAGIIIGPYGFNVLHNVESIELFSKIGIAILLFVVGLNLNPFVIKEIGGVSLFTGIGQVFITSALGFGLLHFLGFSNIESLYGALALTFSSTIIVLKMLSDRGDLEKLYGKISIGVLLVQDILATFAILIISALSTEHEAGIGQLIFALCVKGIGALIIVLLISRYVLPKFSGFFAQSQELLFLFSISWGLGLASLFYGIGFSVEIGALLAGVTLSVSPFAYEIGSRMKPLRDFFITLFFVLLGSQIVVNNASTLVIPIVISVLFVLLLKPLIVIVLMNILGYRQKTGFMTSVTIAQVSEFSLILLTLGLTLGHVSQEIVSVITIAAILSIAGSTYQYIYSDTLYKKMGTLLKLTQLRKSFKRESSGKNTRSDIIIFGYDRVGSDFVKSAEKLEKNYLVVDFNPRSIQKLQEKQIPFKFGDAEDVEFLGELNFHHAKLVISTIPDFRTSMLLVNTYRSVNLTGIIMVISHDIEQAKKLYMAGASYVVMPHYLGAHHASSMISKYGFDTVEFDRERNLHLQRLAKRDSN